MQVMILQEAASSSFLPFCKKMEYASELQHIIYSDRKKTVVKSFGIILFAIAYNICNRFYVL